MKTFDRLGLDDAVALRRYPFGGVVMELRYLSVTLCSVGKFGAYIESPSTLTWGVLGGLLSFTRDFVTTSSLSAGKIDAPRTGVRGQAALSGDNLVAAM